MKATLADLHSVRGDGMIIFKWRVHNKLGRGVWKAIPSCIVWAIRDRYPKPNMTYIPFQLARDKISLSFQYKKHLVYNFVLLWLMITIT